MAASLHKNAAAIRPASGPRVALRPAVGCKAASQTAWSAWDTYMGRRTPKCPEQTNNESKAMQAIGASITKSATSYKPRFLVPHEPHASSIQLKHLDKIQVKVTNLPKDLHERLEAIGLATLKGVLSHEGEVDFATAEYTTSDIGAALNITATTVQQGGEKSVVASFVVCETERQASWSRLEGLILHWACSNAPGGAWAMPPEGWTAQPNKTRDAGGAWQCQFEKRVVGNNEQVYVLVLQLPLRGVLKSGGLVFVIKGTLNQADRWLKDEATDKDFYLDLSKLPTTKL